MMIRWTVCLLLVGSLLGCSDSRPGETAADQLGGDAVVETIRQADAVEVFRLKDRGYSEKLGDYETAEGPFAVSGPLAKELAEVVTAYDSYERGVAVSCAPIYHVRTRFVRGDSTVDIVYCFECSLMTVFHNEKLVGGGLFMPVESQMNSIAKRLLPEDQALQQLR